MNLDDSLNKAHFCERQANRLILANSALTGSQSTPQDNLIKALHSFNQAADHFQAASTEFALDSCNSNCSKSQTNSVLASLRLQRQTCLRQVQLLTEHLKTLENMLSNETDTQQTSNNAGLSDSLKEALLQQISQQDSLIAQLGFEETADAKKPKAPKDDHMTGSKCPKNEALVIEELKFCNQELRRLVQTLLEELEKKTAEIERLNGIIAVQGGHVENEPERARDDSFSLEFEPLDLPQL